MVSKPDLVSIIIPAYRADRFLPETLEHISRQTHPDWELIVVEDGSEGKTEAIVNEFASKHPDHRIVYRRHDRNQGPSASRNTAIEEAQGEFLALVDADDLWFPDHLEQSVERLNSEDRPDITYARIIAFHFESGDLIGVYGPNAGDLADFGAAIFRRNFVALSTVVMRRDVFDKVGPFDTTPELQGCEDVDYWLRCVKAGIRFSFLTGCHCLYRKWHPDAATTNEDRIATRNALVLQKHLGMPQIPLAEQKCHIAGFYRTLGWRRMRAEPFQAASTFFTCWKFYPKRIDALALSGIASAWGLVRPLVAKSDARKTED